jgi:hypothetical protein
MNSSAKWVLTAGCMLSLLSPTHSFASQQDDARWEIRLTDLRLDRALQRWAQQAGYSFRWDADRYLMIGAHSTYGGDIEQAIEAVLKTPGIRASEYPLEACVYRNTPPLIRITRLGDQTDECQ